MATKKIKVASMFCGMGGICLAFKQAGFEIVWANDIDKYVCKTYRLNFGEDYLIENDIKNIKADSLPDFDILTAGFPCQAFSSVGLLEGFNDPRGNLFFDVVRIVETKQPRIILLENVANLVKHDNGNTFQVIFNTLGSLDYLVKYAVMNAKEYGGLPQQRNRIYIVAFKNTEDIEAFEFPKEIPLTVSTFDLVDKEKQSDKYYMDKHKRWDFMLQIMTDRRFIYRFTDWGISKGMMGICPTLLAAMGSRFERIPFFYDDYSIRLLTPRECARLQGFPEDFIFTDKYKKETYKQIGNSVAVPVVRRIAENIMKVLKKPRK